MRWATHEENIPSDSIFMKLRTGKTNGKQIKIVATFGEVLTKKRQSETSGSLDIFCIPISVLNAQKYAKIPPAGHL